MLCVNAPVVDLLRIPDGRRDRQLLMGDEVRLLQLGDGFHYVQSVKDSYIGYVAEVLIAEQHAPTHMVASRATHVYSTENFKSSERHALSFGTRVQVVDERKTFFETSVGFIPKKHLRPIEQRFSDPVTIAQLFFGTPYLWGGNSSAGIDCSGLIQAALLACGEACAGDSGDQERMVGEQIALDAPYLRGDLLFWKGHVAMMVDAETLIHANVHHMATVYENVAAAIARIKAQGDGLVTTRRRP